MRMQATCRQAGKAAACTVERGQPPISRLDPSSSCNSAVPQASPHGGEGHALPPPHHLMPAGFSSTSR